MKQIFRNPILILIVGLSFIITLSASSLVSSQPENNVSVIQKIRDRDNRLIAGVKFDFPPFGSLVDGEVVGFDVDLVRAMADVWGVEVEFVQVTSADRIPKLIAGEVDILAASMTHTKVREELIDFSQTYFLDGQSLLVRTEAGIGGIEDLDGRSVAALAGSTSFEQIQLYASQQGVAIEVFPFQELTTALTALQNGMVDALTSDSIALNQFALADDSLRVVGGLFTQEPYGLGVTNGDEYFAALVNATLQMLKQSGTYDAIYADWFGAETQPYVLEHYAGEWPYTFVTSPIQLETVAESARDRIVRDGRLIAAVATDTERTTEGEYSSFEIDLLKAFAQRWLGDEIFLTVTPFDVGDVSPLASGTADIIASRLVRQHSLEDQINLSQAYAIQGDGNTLVFGLPNFDNQFRDLVNFTLQTMQEDGTYAAIYARWFPDEPTFSVEVWPGTPTDEEVISLLGNGPIPIIMPPVTTPETPLESGPEAVPMLDPEAMPMLNDEIYTVVAGDTLSRISTRYYGSPNYYPVIYAANRAIIGKNQNNILIGQQLKIPPLSIISITNDDNVVYIVVHGDTLSHISLRFYGRASYYPIIYEANKEIIGENQNLILIGQQLAIPNLQATDS